MSAQPPAVAPTLAYRTPERTTGAARLALRRLRTERWTSGHLVAALLMGLLGVLATFDAWQDIFRLAGSPSWTKSEDTHIVMVPVVAAWMVFARRLRIRHCKPTGTALGVLVALLGWGVFLVGYYRGFQTLWHAGAVILMVGCVLSVLGKDVLFRFFPALAVLIFLIPVPTQYRLKIAAPLQTWTAQISQKILELGGIPVERSQNLLTINDVPVNIIEACNGLRMVFALILVSFAFSFGLPLRNSVRFVVLLASPISAIFCNVLRIVPTVWIYGYWSKDPRISDHAGKVFHEFSGWLMLPIAFLILLGILKVLRWAMLPVMRYTLAS
jgi:exosortase